MLLLLSLLSAPADAGPSRQAVSGMSVSELKALRRQYKATVEGIRADLLAAEKQRDITTADGRISTPKQEIRVILRGLDDALDDSNSDDELKKIIEVFSSMDRCLDDMDDGIDATFYDLKSIFGQRYGKGQTLGSWIEADTSGKYEDILLTLCGYVD